MMTRLSQIQQEVFSWSVLNFGYQESKRSGAQLGSLAPLLGVCEEVGELCHAQLKSHQGIRGFDDHDKRREATQDAVGDILIYLMDFCSREGLDIDECLSVAWGEVKSRHWRKPDDDNDEEVLEPEN